MDCKFSIIIPCYNISKYIDELIGRVIKYSYKNCEFILVDDNSTDNSYNLMTMKTKEYDNINIYQTPVNGGPGLTRNYGLSKAKGEYILFLDSDDCFDLSFLNESISDILCKTPDLLVFPYFQLKGKKKRVIDSYVQYGNYEEVKKNDVLLGSCVPFAKIFKRDIIEKYSISFPSRLTGEDECFLVNYCIYAKKIYKVNINYYFYVCNRFSITHKKNIKIDDHTTYEVLENIYREYFPEIILNKFVEAHLLTRAKTFCSTKTKNKEIKRWFGIENSKYPLWIEKIELKNQSLYRRLICKAMYKNNPFLIKLIMKIRSYLY